MFVAGGKCKLEHVLILQEWAATDVSQHCNRLPVSTSHVTICPEVRLHMLVVRRK